MTDVENILDALAANALDLRGTVVANPSASRAYFIPLRLVRHSDGHKIPSGSLLAKAKASLQKIGIAVDFILIDEHARDVEESLRASLLSSFPDKVRNSFYESDEKQPRAWIELKGALDSELTDRLNEHLKNFAKLFSLPCLSMKTIGEANTPTKIEILTVVRQFAPVDVWTLARELAKRGYDVPSTDWVSRRFDALRKADLVLRRKDGTYVLTMEALSRLGTRKGPRSPDLKRLLALARRGM